MPRSKRYQGLRTRIRQLRNHLLPKEFDATGNYTERQIDRASSFMLLSHAEIESYLEDIVVETANSAFDNWKQRGVISKPLIAMLGYSDSSLLLPPHKKSTPQTRVLNDGIETTKQDFNDFVYGRNNGIKATNILNLLLPVGIDEIDIDPLWLGTINTFGSLRGDVAHRTRISNTPRVYNAPDPKTEYENVKTIVDGLSTIDKKLLEYRSE